MTMKIDTSSATRYSQRNFYSHFGTHSMITLYSFNKNNLKIILYEEQFTIPTNATKFKHKKYTRTTRRVINFPMLIRN